MKRRAALGALAATAGAATLTVTFGGCSALPVIPKRPMPNESDARGWVRHVAGAGGGHFELCVPCAEMGQQIAEALRRVAADALGVPARRVHVQLPSSAELPRVRATVGSDSVKDFAAPLAQACTTLREALAAAEIPVAAAASAASAESAGAIGVARREREHRDADEPAFLREIVTGAPLYAADMRLPGMVHGRVLRAPVSPELHSAPAAYDEAAARAVPGFVAVVRDDRVRHAGSLGLGIVARTPGALDRIENALAVRWHTEGTFESADIDAALDIDRHLARGALRHALRRDTLEREGRPWSVDLRFEMPFAAHAAIEPRAALAAVGADAEGRERLQVFTGTQDLFFVRDTLARRLVLPEERVAVQACRIGGGFGARTLVLVELEAALLARAVGAPVKVVWTRAQEFALGFHRPPSSHRIRARVAPGDGAGGTGGTGAQGAKGRGDARITDWWHAFTSSHILFTPAAMPAWMQWAADFVGDQGVARGAALPYAVPRQRIEFDALRLPVHGGPWRGLGAGPNGLAVECAIDACARAAGADALAFRLAHAETDPRLQAVLRAVAADAGWRTGGASAPTRLRRGRGLACGIYKGLTRVAVVADVDVAPDGRARVVALWCAHDCGRVIDADGVRAQVEGCLVWCLGMVLVEQLPLAGGRVAARHFGESPIPRFADVPAMHVRLVESAAAPSGAGESAMTAGAAAIANALHDATGVRATRFPVRPETMQAGAVR